MRGTAGLVLIAILLAGCGSPAKHAETTTTVRKAPPQPVAGLRIEQAQRLFDHAQVHAAIDLDEV